METVKKMQLDSLDVSGTGGAGNIAVIQVAMTSLSEGAKNACKAALTDEGRSSRVSASVPNCRSTGEKC